MQRVFFILFLLFASTHTWAQSLDLDGLYQRLQENFESDSHFKKENLNSFRSNGLSPFLSDCEGCFRGNYKNDRYLSSNEIESSPNFFLPEKSKFQITLEALLKFSEKNIVVNSNLVTIIDLSLHSSQRRLWVIDLDLEKVLIQTFVTHGAGSDPDCDGNANCFSNTTDSKQSSIGSFVTTLVTPSSNFQTKLPVKGLSGNLNSNAFTRNIVFHKSGFGLLEILNNKKAPTTQGCFGLPYYESANQFGLGEMAVSDWIMNKISGGTFVQVFGN